MKGITLVIIIGAGCYFSLLQPFQPAEKPDSAEGSIVGTVVLAPKQAPARFGGGRYGRPSPPSASSRVQEDSVLVWLVGSQKPASPPSETPVVLDQIDQKFNPVLLPVRQHGTVRIRNSDPVYHNVFSLSGTKKFDVGRRPKGEYLDVTFDKPGIVDVFCDIHSNMHAVIYVMPPEVLIWTKVKGGDSFGLKNVPPGSYELKIYALGYEERSVTVEVVSGEPVNVGTITLSS